MIIKLGFKNLKRNILMNTLTILQMTVIFIIAISMTSTIVSRFQYYSPLKNILNSRSYYYYIYNGFNPQTGSAWTNTRELGELINEEEKIYASYNAWLEYSNNGVNENINTISYDNEFLKLYQPELESGAWFKEGIVYPKELIPIVVSQNNFDINTGDTVTLVCSETNEQIQGYIIGKLKDGTKIFDYSIASNKDFNCKNMFKNYYIEIEEKPLFILPQQYLENENIVTQVSGPLIITYNFETSEEIIKSNDSVIKNMLTLSASATEKIKHNSIKYIFSQFNNLLPILISILIMTLVSSVSVSALSTKRQLKNYAVYYICGLKWKQCSLINLVSCTAIAFISIIIANVITIVLKNTFFSESVLELGILQVIICLGISFLYIVLSALLPLKIIKNNTPREVLKSN